jgi:ABC-type spermidine/putrescine transport system permease subunit I
MELRPRERRKQALLGLLLVLPSFLVTVVVVVFPIIESVILSVSDPETGAFTWKNFQTLFADPATQSDIGFTLQVVVTTVVLALVLAYALSYYMTFSNTKGAVLLAKVYQIPLFIPGIVAVYALIAIIRDTGALNRFVHLFGGDFKPGLMYTGTGIILVNLWFNVPFAAMIIGASLAGIPRSLLEAARDVGAGRFTVFRTVVFPLSAKSSLVAALFVFMNNISEFTTPFLMGSNAPHMLGVALYQKFAVFNDHNGAAALSVFLFALSSVAGGVYIRSMMKEDRWRGQ